MPLGPADVRPALRAGVVSVVVVESGGTVLPALQSIETAGVPAELLQVVVVTQERPADRSTQPYLEIVQPGSRSLRRSRGADAAGGEFMALVDGDVAMPAGVLGSLVDTLHREVRTGAVAPATGTPAPTARQGQALDAFSVPLGLVVLRTAAWREAGGLTPELDGVLEDVDLGWRLWLLGYRVRLRADLGGGPLAEPPSATEADRARDVMLVRNVSDAVLDEWYATADAERRRLTERLLAGRARVQASRRVDDRQLLALVRRGDLLGASDPAVERALGQRDSLPSRRRVLVVTGDTLGSRMAGPAIRAWEMAHALGREHDVVLAALGGSSLTSPSVRCLSAGEQELRDFEQWCEVLIFQGYLLRDHPWLLETSAVLVADLYDPIQLEVLEQDRSKPLAARAASLDDVVATVSTQLRRADFFLCASTTQRDLWLGALSVLGRVNAATYDGDEQLEQLIAVVPFGISATPPVPAQSVIRGIVPGIGAEDTVLLWGGGIYNWFDPLTLLHAVDRVRRVRDDVRLFFLGTKHPNPMVPAMRMATSARSLSQRLGLLGTHVFFNEDWVPYDRRGEYLLEADIGVSCHYEHVETRFSFRTRILDYLWAGLPIVTTSGDVFADLVRSEGLGEVVPPEDVDALAGALLRLVEDRDTRAACARDVARVASGFTWDVTLEPLLAFCRSPRYAADRFREGVPDPAAVLAGPPRTVRSELTLARDYLQRGGVLELARRAAGRVLRQLKSALD